MKDGLDAFYFHIRAEERVALEARVEAAFAKAPELRSLDEGRKQLFFEVGAKTISPTEGVARLNELNLREQAVLKKLGLPADALTLHYRCPDCKDTGYVGQAPKKPCACRLRYRQELAAEASINAKETFAAFDETIFPNDTQKKRTCNAKILCERYAAALPHPERPNLLITGMPGLGKSFLGNAVAYAAITQGVDTLRVTAYRFVQDMLEDIRSHTNNAKRYCGVPLLVLDDLGSEPDIPNVSLEWLFAIVNERLMQQRATVCITNLSLKELQQRYGERLMSRLCDRSATLILQLTGENLRTLS